MWFANQTKNWAIVHLFESRTPNLRLVGRSDGIYQSQSESCRHHSIVEDIEPFLQVLKQTVSTAL